MPTMTKAHKKWRTKGIRDFLYWDNIFSYPSLVVHENGYYTCPTCKSEETTCNKEYSNYKLEGKPCYLATGYCGTCRMDFLLVHDFRYYHWQEVRTYADAQLLKRTVIKNVN